MVRDLKIRNDRITVLLNFYVLAVIFTDRYGRVDDIRDRHHDLLDALLEIFFFLLQLSKVVGSCCNLFLNFLSLFLLALSHQCADLLGDLISARAEVISLLLYFSVLLVQFDHFVY